MLRVERVSSAHWTDRLKIMVEQPSRFASFLAELRRRHVFRVAAGYAVFAFVVLQLGEIVLPAFSAEWALQLVVVFSVLGFPVVMVLAWVFDVTSEGIRVTDAWDQDANLVRPSAGILPRLALMAVTLLAVGGVGSWWVLSTVSGPDASTATQGQGPSVVPVAYDPDVAIRSLAVLPLQNFSEDEGQDYFVAGMHEALIEHLSQLPEIRVVSRTSVARYSTTDQTTPEIAQELGVEALLEGSVIRADDEVRITVQLIHGPSDTPVWTRSYERTFSNVLALQREVAGAIAEEIASRLSVDGGVPVLASDGDATILAAGMGSEVPAANEAFMQARYAQFGESPGGLQAALALYREAVEADPTFAEGYAGLASTEFMLGMSEDSDLAESLARARVFALKAFEVDPELPEAHDILALIDEQLGEEGIESSTGADPPRAMTEVRLVRSSPTTSDGAGDGAVTEDSVTVISVNPNVVSTAADFGRDSTQIDESLTPVGRQLRAASADRASRSGQLATMEPARMMEAAQRFKAVGRSEAAIEVLVALSEREPGHAEAWEDLELLYASTGAFGQLLDSRRRWVETAGGDVESVDRLEDQMRADGPEGYWQWRLDDLQERASEGETVSPVYLGAAQAALGDVDAAVASLREAVRIRDRRLMSSLRTDSVWDVLRSDPRFSSLMRGITSGRQGRAGRGQGRGGRGGGGGPV